MIKAKNFSAQSKLLISTSLTNENQKFNKKYHKQL